MTVLPCIGNDPLCPCQDGDACHYREVGGTPPMPMPVREDLIELTQTEPDMTIDGIPMIEYIAWYGRAEVERVLNEAVPGMVLGKFFEGWDP